MLLQLTVENYLSFRDRTVLSMLADPRVSHAKGQVEEGPGGRGVLRAAAVYGANGSGKSNLIKALTALQAMVTNGTHGEEPLPIVPFKLDPNHLEAPSHFEVELFVSGTHYSYGFAATAERVDSEWLFEVDGAGEEKPLFEREAGVFRVGDALSTDPKRRQFLEFVADGTRPNQLFLAEAGERNVQELLHLRKDIKRWQMVAPDTPYKPLIRQIQNDAAFRNLIASILKAAGTGIEDVKVRTRALPLEEMPEEVAKAFKFSMNLSPSSPIAEGAADALASQQGAELRMDERGELQLSHLFSVHELPDGQRFELRMAEESDGTRRLINLAPIFQMGAGPTPFFAVDELERSLHTSLTRMLLQLFLAGAPSEAAAQLIFTTHDTNLLDHRLLSRDSIWLMEKDPRGGSALYPLSDLDQAQIDEVERQGNGLERGYLQGRFGAIPFFGSLESLGLRKDLLKRSDRLPSTEADSVL